MEPFVRTFVAVPLAPSTRRHLLACAARLKGEDPALRLPHERDLHLTIQFLGRTATEDLAAIGRTLEAATEAVSPIDVAFRGLGAFPDIERPRVIWAGVPEDDGGSELRDLASTVGRALRSVGYRPEKRRFHPHVTLARVQRRPSERVFEELAGSGEMDLGAEILSELKLILSDPTQRPYHYIDLTTVELGG